MKIRHGFVSNSSSSSFVICSKRKLTSDEIKTAFGVIPGSFAADRFYMPEKHTLMKDFLDNYCCETEEEFMKESYHNHKIDQNPTSMAFKYLKMGYFIYEGSISRSESNDWNGPTPLKDVYLYFEET